jgi:hypothetical protein
MQAAAVVEHDPVLDVAASAGSVGPLHDADLRLDRGEEGFCGGAAEARPGAAGALADLQTP